MRMQGGWGKVILVTACVAASGAGGVLAVRSTGPALGDEQVGATPSPGDGKNAAGAKAIQDKQAGYVKAFNAGDAEGTAAFWAADGEFVDADGKSFKGRGAIAKEFASFFAEAKGLRLEVRTDSLR